MYFYCESILWNYKFSQITPILFITLKLSGIESFILLGASLPFEDILQFPFQQLQCCVLVFAIQEGGGAHFGCNRA